MDSFKDITLFNSDDLKKSTGPLVYVHKRNGEVIYIGYSQYGIQRCFGHRKFRNGDSLELIHFEDDLDARKCERDLINRHKPIDNKDMCEYIRKTRKYARGAYLIKRSWD